MLVEQEPIGLVVGLDDERRLGGESVGQLRHSQIGVASQVGPEIGAEELLVLVDVVTGGGRADAEREPRSPMP